MADALAEHKANRSGNRDDIHDSGSGRRRQCLLLASAPIELALICERMFPEESDQVDKYIRGLPDMIQGSVMASKPNTMQEAIEIANDRWTRRSPVATNNQRILTCYECGNQGHYMSDFPKLKNRNHGNQAGGTEARGMVYALGGGQTDQDLNNMEDNMNA
uniref:CCHC-type domain-containing protein n=1 Tax=Tanacetum cinerariifolium TaxID=118510 RepID=A0A6L2JCK7_TANCI|nr:hypothetical protein [Tanacetum cinerariifolium]